MVLALVLCQHTRQVKAIHDVYVRLCQDIDVTVSSVTTSEQPLNTAASIKNMQNHVANIVISPISELFDLANWYQGNKDACRGQDNLEADSEDQDEHTDAVTLAQRFFLSAKILTVVKTGPVCETEWDEDLKHFADIAKPIMPATFALISVSHRHAWYLKIIAHWGLSAESDVGQSWKVVDDKGDSDGLAPQWTLVPHIILSSAIPQDNETMVEKFATSVEKHIDYKLNGMPSRKTILVCGDAKQTYQVADIQGKLSRNFARHSVIAHERQKGGKKAESLRAFAYSQSFILVTTIHVLHSVSKKNTFNADQVIFLDYPDDRDIMFDNIISAMLITGGLGPEGTAQFFFDASSQHWRVFHDLMARFKEFQPGGFNHDLWLKEAASPSQLLEDSSLYETQEKQSMSESEAKYKFCFDETE